MRFEKGLLTCTLAGLAILGCHASPSRDGGPSGSTGQSGPSASASTVVYESGTFTIEAAAERYVCFTARYDQAMSIQRFDYGGVEGVHHVFMARTLSPEPDGSFECQTLFKTNWLPIFTAGASGAALAFPDDTTLELPAQTQVLVQLHLLNASARSITGKVKITMQLARQPGAHRAVLFPFGTTVINLAPHTTGAVSQDCKLQRDLDVFAVFPHMHLLGKKLTFEAGDSADSLTTVYDTPWDFTQQYIQPMTLSLKTGQFTRVTCQYDNNTDMPVTYGESTHDEMCFLSVFVKDGADLDGQCLNLDGFQKDHGGGDGGPDGDGPPPSGDGGTCTTQENELGIGRPCTKGGGECSSGLLCTVDLASDQGNDGLCISLGCSASDACGTGASCCQPSGGGGVSICIPESCRPSDCAPVSQ